MTAGIGQAVLAQFAKERSVIFKPSQGPCPVFARGDKRTRATHWLSQKTVNGMIAEGMLVQGEQGYSLAPSLRARVLNPAPERQFQEQHGTVSEREIFTPQKAIRRLRRNESFSVLRRLGKSRDRQGQPKLSSALIEAGERFANDYAASGRSDLATQNYAASGADNSGRHDSIERRHLSRIDAGSRCRAAQEKLGPKLGEVIIAVCCNQHDLQALERAEGWASGSGLPVLRVALTQLAEHYGTFARSQN